MTRNTKVKLNKYLRNQQCQYEENRSSLVEYVMRKQSSPNRKDNKDIEKKIQALNKAIARLFNDLEKNYPELIKDLGL